MKVLYWQSCFMALNEQCPVLLWKVSLSASINVSFLDTQCDASCSVPDLFWLSSATSLNDASPKQFDEFWYFFRSCHTVLSFPILRCFSISFRLQIRFQRILSSNIRLK